MIKYSLSSCLIERVSILFFRVHLNIKNLSTFIHYMDFLSLNYVYLLKGNKMHIDWVTLIVSL
mgnify:CR=1 FL=1